ncbi:pectate lyase [Geofilum rubicundum JCM 15548]|uniref:Pectate lyase n=2 Tax=Geofilum TaxID=1236988 RepID=A0A0E9LZ57_9BACT|nr:pectate lyase [Geofilum rubicundum JCM 15548]
MVISMLFMSGIALMDMKAAPDVAEEVIENSTPVAFPGAEGFGRFATGGRGGRIIYVTNLNNSGAGSFRQAVEVETGARIVVFNVSGIIELESRINIKNGSLTIAGQTAPGDGITLKNHEVYVGANNVIIRFLRFRMGDERQTENDAMWGRRQNTIIIDHCTMSWATDEASSFYDNNDFTMQWCLLSESLRISVHDKGKHGYLGIWGGKKASFHHNLMAHHDSRNPRFCGSRYSNLPDQELVDFRNNVIYNWGANSGYAGEGGSYNMVNNYYKPGPASSNRSRIFQPNPDNGSNAQPAGVWGVFYVHGNYMNQSTSVTTDNWVGIHPNPSSKNKEELKSYTEFDKGLVTTHSAQDAFDAVLAHAGASFKRDAIDERIARETSTGTYTYTGSNGSTNGLIDSQADVGGWPNYESLPARLDSDGDGMPDVWETQFDLDPNDATDGKGYDLNTMFTNVEVYLNSLVQHILDQKNEAGVANYADTYEVLAPGATLNSSGETTQVITGGDDINTFSFSWNHALSVEFTGLPAGLEIDIDENQKTGTISGRPAESGVFEYTVATIGAVIPAYASGSITVEGDVPNSLNSLQANQGLSVFPNPFNDHLSISSEFSEISAIDIYAYDGRLVQQVEVNAFSVNINSSDLNSGLYVLQVRFADGSRHAAKLIKE